MYDGFLSNFFYYLSSPLLSPSSISISIEWGEGNYWKLNSKGSYFCNISEESSQESTTDFPEGGGEVGAGLKKWWEISMYVDYLELKELLFEEFFDELPASVALWRENLSVFLIFLQNDLEIWCNDRFQK